MCKSVFVPRGIDVPPLNTVKQWEFKPKKEIKEGTLVTGGDIFGIVHESNLFDEHRIMVPPKGKGRVTYIAPEGNYNITDKVLEVEYEGKTYKYSMS